MKNKLEEKMIKKPGANVEPIKEQPKPPVEPEQPEVQPQAPANIEDGFKEALSYFGPRLATLVLGGTEAMETTDTLLTGFDKLQADKAKAKQDREDKLAALKEKDALTPYQQASLKMRGKEFEQRERSQQLRETKEGRLTKTAAFSRDLKQRLSDKEVKDISVMEDGNRIIDEIETLFKSGKVDESLGPYASNIESSKQYVPGMERDENFVKMQQLVGINLAEYIKSISGAQVSEQEAQRLLKNLPTVDDKPAAFRTKLEQFKKEFKEARVNYLQNIGVQKGYAEKFLAKDKVKEEPKDTDIEKDNALIDKYL